MNWNSPSFKEICTRKGEHRTSVCSAKWVQRICRELGTGPPLRITEGVSDVTPMPTYSASPRGTSGPSPPGWHMSVTLWDPVPRSFSSDQTKGTYYKKGMPSQACPPRDISIVAVNSAMHKGPLQLANGDNLLAFQVAS